jgi:hypothetical protein
MYIIVKYGVLNKFYNMIIVHLFKEKKIMKQFDIHDFFHLFYFKISTNQLSIKFLKSFKIMNFMF